jgi:hypothetical protein
MTEVQSDQFRRQRHLSVDVPKRTSRMARASIVCAALFFVPFAPLAATAMGLVAVSITRRRTMLRGTGLAIAAVCLGLVFSVAQAGVAWCGYRAHKLVSDTPSVALTMGFAGNVDRFRSFFDDAPSNEETREFLDSVRTRYGGFIECRLAPDASTPLLAPRATEFSYVVRFTDATCEAEAHVAVDPGAATSWRASQLASIRIIDPERGDLVDPAGPELATRRRSTQP